MGYHFELRLYYQSFFHIAFETGDLNDPVHEQVNISKFYTNSQQNPVGLKFS